MTERRQDALTELVQQSVGRGRRFSVRAFAEVAVDPETGYPAGKSLIGKIIKGQSFVVSPKLIGALAAGLGVDREIVAEAARTQFIGPAVSDPFGRSVSGQTVRVAHDPGARPQDMPNVQRFVDTVLGKNDSSES